MGNLEIIAPTPIFIPYESVKGLDWQSHCPHTPPLGKSSYDRLKIEVDFGYIMTIVSRNNVFIPRVCVNKTPN